MNEKWVVKGFEIGILVTIVIAGFGQAVLQLWNWLMPNIFGLNRISFWQAVGLLGLSWILFGGFRGGRFFGHRGQHSMRERWGQMTPEQRDRFRKGLQHRCGKVDSSTTGPEASS
jgi:hypothetical protein